MTQRGAGKALPVLRVSAALWRRGHHVLLAQRPEGKHLAGTWELPGGKQRLGERAPQALQRECREELAVDVEVGPEWARVEHNYEDFRLIMRIFQIRSDAEPQSAEGQALVWADAKHLRKLPMPPADEALQRRLARELEQPAPTLWEQSISPAVGVGDRVEQKLWRQGLTSHDELLKWLQTGPLNIAGLASSRQLRLLRRSLEHWQDQDWRSIFDQLAPRHRWRLLEAMEPETLAIDFECDRQGEPTMMALARVGKPTELYLAQEAISAFLETAPRVLPGRWSSEGRLDGAPVRLYPFETLPDRWMPGAILTFAGRKFDLNMLRRLLGTDVPLDRHFDLSDLTRRVGMRGGLKVAERRLGIQRDPRIAALRGRQAMALWDRFLSGGDQGIWALADLMAYNRADAANLFPLRDGLLKRMRHQVGSPDWYLRG